MPKKFSTENTKAVAAKARKDEKKEDDQTRKKKDAEDAYWQDDDKKTSKKQLKKDDEERKRQLQVQKKAESKTLLEKEMSGLATTSKKPTQDPTKITRAQIEKAKEKSEAKASADAVASSSSKSKVVVAEDMPLEENVNRLETESGARTVDEAIVMLGGDNDATAEGDAHPERRMRAAFAAYQERRLAELKLEHPSLRLSQLKQMVFKDWQRAPENPMRTKE